MDGGLARGLGLSGRVLTHNDLISRAHPDDLAIQQDREGRPVRPRDLAEGGVDPAGQPLHRPDQPRQHVRAGRQAGKPVQLALKVADHVLPYDCDPSYGIDFNNRVRAE